VRRTRRRAQNGALRICLILLGWRAHPDYPLVMAANRDEFHARAAAPADFWNDLPILAGRDLQAGGTWMGVSRGGSRFAAVTNYRGAQEASAPESRGALVTRYLGGGASPQAYMEALEGQAQAYSGFNLLLADERELWWMSNRDGAPRKLSPGVYGLGNTLLDAAEVDEPKASFAKSLRAPAVEALFSVLAERQIVNPLYGTRCSTVLRTKPGEVRYAERSFSGDGTKRGTRQFALLRG
jgi:uncharacterized protein with NRDE domain